MAPTCIFLASKVEVRFINPFPHKPWFLCVCSISLLKALWEKEKLLETNNFSFFPTVFSTFLENFLPLSNRLTKKTFLFHSTFCNKIDTDIQCFFHNVNKFSRDKLSFESGCKNAYSFTKQALVCTCLHSKSFENTEGKGVTSNFSFSRSVFHPSGELSAIFIKFRIVICKLFDSGRV